MAKKRKRHSIQTKAAVALAAIKEEMTLAELARKYGIHPTQIQRWKKQALSEFSSLFSNSTNSTLEEKEKEIEELYKHIGQLKVELDWLKKKSGFEY